MKNDIWKEFYSSFRIGSVSGKYIKFMWILVCGHLKFNCHKTKLQVPKKLPTFVQHTLKPLI